MKYKAGDKVRVVSSTYYDDMEVMEMIGKVCEVMEADNGIRVKVWTQDKSNWFSFDESDLEPVEKTLYTLEVGDVVVNEYTGERVVLEVLTQSCLLSSGGGEDSTGCWFTFKEMEVDGFKLKETQPTTLKMTVSEIAEKLGHEVEIVKES